MIEGSIVAIVTPMQDDGAIDYDAFDALLDWHVEQGTDAIVVVGTTGESATLSTEEHCALVAHCVSQINGRIPVIAGTGSNSTAEALNFTQSAKDNGADAALLVTPYYNRPGQEGLYRHFKTIAETVDIPQIPYNVPSRTACNLLPDTIERLVALDNIVAIKDASGELETGLELIQRCAGKAAIYSGEDGLSRTLMLGGGKGTISVTANVAPALMAEMCRLAIAGDDAASAKIDEKLQALHNDLFVEANPIPVKWALQELGRMGPTIRLPLTELDAANYVKVRSALQQAGVL